MTKKKSQVKAKSPAARKITKKKGSTQPLQTKISDDQTNMKPKKADSIQETKNLTKVVKKTSNVKKKTSMTSKAEIIEQATQTQKKLFHQTVGNCRFRCAPFLSDSHNGDKKVSRQT